MSKRITRKRHKTTSKTKRHKTKRRKTNKYRPRKYYLFGGNSNVHREQFRNMFIKISLIITAIVLLVTVVF